MTGISFLSYANRYREAALVLASTPKTNNRFDPAVYFLYCLSLELHLKSFIWLHDKISRKNIKDTYRHDINKLWRHCKERGINKYAKPTPLRDHVIELIGPYYKNRKLNYLDLDMVFRGYTALKAEPRIVPTLDRLTKKLGQTLHDPILNES